MCKHWLGGDYLQRLLSLLPISKKISLVMTNELAHCFLSKLQAIQQWYNGLKENAHAYLHHLKLCVLRSLFDWLRNIRDVCCSLQSSQIFLILVLICWGCACILLMYSGFTLFLLNKILLPIKKIKESARTSMGSNRS